MEATDEAGLRLARGVDHVLNLDMAQAEAEVAPFRAARCGHALLYAAVNYPPPFLPFPSSLHSALRSFSLSLFLLRLAGNRWPRFGRC